MSKLDYDVVVNIGHKLKGNGKTFGFSDISEVGDLIEQAGISKNKSSLEEYINAFEIGIFDKLKTIEN